MADSPLVSVIIPTHNRADLLVGRAIPSVLSQTHQNLELIVVADRCTDDTKLKVEKLNDPRIHFVELTDRPPLPDDLYERWRVASAAPRNKGLELAKGDWICLLDDDDEFTPDHIEILLRRALEGYEFVYGKFLWVKPNGETIVSGNYPREYGQFGACSFIYSSKYRGIRCNTDPKATQDPCDWNLESRIIDAGAKVSFVDDIVYTYYQPVRDFENQTNRSILIYLSKRIQIIIDSLCPLCTKRRYYFELFLDKIRDFIEAKNEHR